MSYQTVKAIIEGLITATPNTDPDKQLAESDGMIEQIVELFAECYTGDDLIKWLADHNNDPLQDYRYSNRLTYEEIAEELDNGNECIGVYNIDFDEWQEIAKDDEEARKDYIKKHLDCLMYSDDVVVVSW